LHKIYTDNHSDFPFFTATDDYTCNVFTTLLSNSHGGIKKYPRFGCLDYTLDDEYNFKRALDQIKSEFPEIEVVVVESDGGDCSKFIKSVRELIALDDQASCA